MRKYHNVRTHIRECAPTYFRIIHSLPEMRRRFAVQGKNGIFVA
jgi:hypothetical protein